MRPMKSKPLFINLVNDAQAMSELKQVIAQTEDLVDRALPGLSSGVRSRVVQVVFGILMIYPDADQKTVMEKYVEVSQEAVKNNEQWAKDAAMSALTHRIRPSYEKAVKAGVDPVDFLRVDLEISQQNAQELVDALAGERKV